MAAPSIHDAGQSGRTAGPLHAFISEHRAEILEICVDKMKKVSPDRPRAELEAELPGVLDEIVGALQEDAGLDVSSPLPDESPTAAAHGVLRQQSGYEIEKLALDFGTISDTVGELGAREGRLFHSREYQVFDRCIDMSISNALEQYAARERDKHDEVTAQRIGRLVHELRNALASARMAFAVLRQGRVSVDSRTGMVLDRSLRRLQALVDQTLASVQLHSGLPPAPRPLAVSTLVREIAETAVPERGISIHFDVDDALEVEADERLLTSALSNLVQNAFKFTRPGGRIVVRGCQDGGSAVIEVEDECGGLPPGKAEELFAPFTQRASDRRGLGLGLSITQEAVAAQGGELAVRNRPGRGCVFSVRLPRPALGMAGSARNNS